MTFVHGHLDTKGKKNFFSKDFSQKVFLHKKVFFEKSIFSEKKFFSKKFQITVFFS